MAETQVTFRCGHTGTLPYDAATAEQIIRDQKRRPAWRNLCPICRPTDEPGAGGNE
jgi:hypothetical protein